MTTIEMQFSWGAFGIAFGLGVGAVVFAKVKLKWTWEDNMRYIIASGLGVLVVALLIGAFGHSGGGPSAACCGNKACAFNAMCGGGKKSFVKLKNEKTYKV